MRPAFAGVGVSPAPAGRAGRSTLPDLSGAIAETVRLGSLAILGIGAALFVPLLIAPVFSGVPDAASMDTGDEQLRAFGVAPLASGAGTGEQMAPTSAVEPLDRAPARPARAASALQAATPTAPPVTMRVRGRIADDLYASLRLAQVAPATSAAFLRLLSAKLNLLRDVGPDDHFDLVISGVAVNAAERDGTLLYAAIDRAGASDVRLMKWGARGAWIDTAAAENRGGSMVWPVAGRISSGFGLRYHPILHFARMHRGVDFAAGWGQPVLAASDGIVSRAGWAGGYGKQVRIAHAGGLATSYSHLDRLAVAPGRMVRSGQLIGYVGSTGLSTGPHLHYEVYRGGQAINPLTARFAAASPVAREDLDRFRARLGQILAMRVVPPLG